MVITQEESGGASGQFELASIPAMYSNWLLLITLVPLKFHIVLHYYGKHRFLFKATVLVRKERLNLASSFLTNSL